MKVINDARSVLSETELREEVRVTILHISYNQVHNKPQNRTWSDYTTFFHNREQLENSAPGCSKHPGAR